MLRTEYNDKTIIVEILAKPFNNIKSINYIIKQDDKCNFMPENPNLFLHLLSVS